MDSNQRMNIVIVGHVDHGKSTVIGRLLADTDSLPQGKLQQIQDLCERTSKPFEYAFLLDALKDEQAQGITIDAARVFFKSQKRHYIIIDAPGHIEFLKNMITGASRAEAALLVIDAQEGIRENSRRHGYMLSMLGIRSIAVLVNKMDLMGYAQPVFQEIQAEYGRFLKSIDLEPAAYIPVSGLLGDNIVTPSARLPWYHGPTVLETLDHFTVRQSDENQPFRMAVQDVYKFTRFGDSRRIIAGTISTGSLRVGDRVVFYPSGKNARVASIETFPRPTSPDISPMVETAGNAVGFTLNEQIYVSRGEIAARERERPPQVSTRMKVSLFWLGRQPMVRGKTYLLRIGAAKVPAHLEGISRLIDASSLQSTESPEQINRHDVSECVLRCDQPMAFDLSAEISETGRFVLIDQYEISGGGIILESLPDDQSWVRDKVLVRNLKWEKSTIARVQRSEHYSQKSALVLVTGAVESNKKELAKALEAQLFHEGRLVYYLGIGNLLYGVDADLKTLDIDSKIDHREEHLRRFGEVAHLMLDAGMILVATAVELTQADLEIIQTILQTHHLIVVWAGDGVTTDIPITDRIASEEPTAKGVSRIKATLQEAGIIFRG